MKNTYRFLLILMILVLAAIACSGTPSSTPSASGDVLFQDDFSNPSSGWDRLSQDDGETEYGDGYYRIFVNTTRMDYWANPGLNFTDVRIEVDATKAGGPDDNDYGVICRYQDNRNFYEFLISSDGYYGIVKVKDGKQEPLGSDALQPSDTINQGEATNRIRADCIGNTLTLYINGELVGQAEDTEYTSGDVGLVAGSFDAPGTDIHFDNFIVYKP